MRDDNPQCVPSPLPPHVDFGIGIVLDLYRTAKPEVAQYLGVRMPISPMVRVAAEHAEPRADGRGDAGGPVGRGAMVRLVRALASTTLGDVSKVPQ